MRYMFFIEMVSGWSKTMILILSTDPVYTIYKINRSSGNPYRFLIIVRFRNRFRYLTILYWGFYIGNNADNISSLTELKK